MDLTENSGALLNFTSYRAEQTVSRRILRDFQHKEMPITVAAYCFATTATTSQRTAMARKKPFFKRNKTRL